MTTMSRNNQIRLIYQLGYPNMGNTSSSGTLAATNPPDYRNEPFTLPSAQKLDLNVKSIGSPVFHGWVRRLVL